MKDNIITAWYLEEDVFLRRRLGKLGEEMGELISIKDRILIQGLEGCDPKSKKENLQALMEECADVVTQIELLSDQLDFDMDKFYERVKFKKNSMIKWEELLAENDKVDSESIIYSYDELRRLWDIDNKDITWNQLSMDDMLDFSQRVAGNNIQ